MPNARLLLDALVAFIALLTSLLFSAPAHPEKTSPKPGYSLSAPRRATKTKLARSRALRHKRRQPVVNGRIFTVTATAYQAVASQTDDEPFVTADNSQIRPHYGSKKRWMALSNDLLKRWGGHFDYGDKVRVRGISPELDGVYTVHDTMNRRYRHCMDVLTHPSEKVDIFTKGVKIQKVSF